MLSAYYLLYVYLFLVWLIDACRGTKRSNMRCRYTREELLEVCQLRDAQNVTCYSDVDFTLDFTKQKGSSAVWNCNEAGPRYTW